MVYDKISNKLTQQLLGKDVNALLMSLNNTSAMVSITDCAGNITYANDKFVKVSKYSREELIGQNHRILKSGTHSDEFFKDLWSTITAGRMWRGDVCNKDKRGNLFWVDNSIAPVLDADGEPEQYISVRFLVTNQHKVEQDLREQQLLHEQEVAKEKALVRSISDGIIVRDTARVITKINPAFTVLTGYTEDDLIGKKLMDVICMIGLNGKRITEKNIAYYLERTAKESVRGEVTWINKDGSKIVVQVTASPYLMDGKSAGTLTIVRDISDQAAIEKAKTEFVSLAAHQLRTPLSSVNWYLELMADDKDGQLSDNQKKYLSEVMQANERMVDLVNDLLNVSRIDIGTFSIRPSPTDLPEVIKSVLTELESEITKKLLRVETAYTGRVDQYKIDPQLARIVFQNLISNAVKYTPQQGNIHIEVALDTKKLLITISDTGYGIPKSQQTNIFNKLFRADNVVKKGTEGTGLGLYLTKAIVEKSGGKIKFVSKVNKGSSFIVELPGEGIRHQTGNSILSASSRSQF